MIEAMIWLFEEAHGETKKATICYDSKYAEGITTGRLDAKTNIKFAEEAIDSRDRLKQEWEIVFN